MNNHFFAILLAVLVLIGCNKQTQQSDTMSPGFGPGVSTLDIPMPTVEILSALGPENNISIQHLLPNPLFVVFGKPKQFMASPIGVGNEEITTAFLTQSLQPFGIVLDTIVFFVQANGLPLRVPIVVPQQDPNQPPQQRLLPIARRTTVITFDAPIDSLALLMSILGPNENPAARKRTEGKTEYYDITPPDAVFPHQRFALALIDERTVVFAEGIEEDIKAVFSDTAPKGAALERLKHAPMDDRELTVITSLEGLPISPEAWNKLMEDMRETRSIPQIFMPLIEHHLRAMTLSLNVSAENGQPVVSVSVEGRDAKGAETIGETIQGTLLGFQTSLAAMNEDAKKTMPVPADFVLELLNALSVKVEGERVSIALNNFETLIPAVAEGINHYQISTQRASQQQRQLQSLRGLGGLCIKYCVEDGKFPADIVDADGKPLLSWRVALLPLLAKLFPQSKLDELYNKFKLDEPWDSENNRELLGSMPVFFHSMSADAPPPKTIFRFFDSPGTPFSNRNLTIDDAKNLENTFMLVLVNPQSAVEWTKPEPLEFDIGTIADTVGNVLLGVTFAGEIRAIQILPESDPRYEAWKRDIEMLVKGMPPQP